MAKINKNFFNAGTLEIAKELLGMYLVHITPAGELIGEIVETEAYLYDDPASHSFSGITKRNEVMFEEAGKAYVYFIYGNHYCFNVVTNKRGIGEAVLIRAIRPMKGIEIMKKARQIDILKNLCNGPGKLTKAMGITDKHNGCDLISGKLRIEKPLKKDKFEIVQTTRIGIKRGNDLPYRFYIKNSDFISYPLP